MTVRAVRLRRRLWAVVALDGRTVARMEGKGAKGRAVRFAGLRARATGCEALGEGCAVRGTGLGVRGEGRAAGSMCDSDGPISVP